MKKGKKQIIFISTSSFNFKNFFQLKKVLRKGFEIVVNPFGRRLTPEEVFSFFNSNIIGVLAGVESIQKESLYKAPNLRVISRCGGGIDNIDITTAHKLNIHITCTPEPPVEAVAELTVGSMINLLRNSHSVNQEIREGIWSPKMGNLLSDQVVGILGFGRIGSRVYKILKAFGTKVIAYDSNKKVFDSQIKIVSFNKILSESDIISLHLPLDKKSYHIIGEAEFKKMKPNACLLNFSRGGLVDEIALYKALKTKKIRGAALDCFENEPYKGPFSNLQNIILSPHMGSYAIESRNKMEYEASKNLIESLQAQNVLPKNLK